MCPKGWYGSGAAGIVAYATVLALKGWDGSRAAGITAKLWYDR